jgi:hypothetical protein
MKPAPFSNLEFGSAQQKGLVLTDPVGELSSVLCVPRRSSLPARASRRSPAQTDSGFAMYIFPLPTVACFLRCNKSQLIEGSRLR